jgi:hypothetical protein
MKLPKDSYWEYEFDLSNDTKTFIVEA